MRSVVDLGWPTHLPWEFSPRTLLLLLGRWVESERAKDYRAGIIAATVANVHRDGEKTPTPYTPADFFPHLEPTEEEDEPDGDPVFQKFWAFSVAHNAQIKAESDSE